MKELTFVSSEIEDWGMSPSSGNRTDYITKKSSMRKGVPRGGPSTMTKYKVIVTVILEQGIIASSEQEAHDLATELWFERCPNAGAIITEIDHEE